MQINTVETELHKKPSNLEELKKMESGEWYNEMFRLILKQTTLENQNETEVSLTHIKNIAEKERARREYPVIKTVTLSESEWNNFVADFYQDFEFLKDVDTSHGIILIQLENGKEKLAVDPSGYNYPRHVGLVS